MKTRILFAILAAGPVMLLMGVLHAQSQHIGPADIFPDPALTPGAASPEITQENIQDNICKPQWSTRLVRPPSGYTSRLKRNQLREYGDTVHQTRAELINPNYREGRQDPLRGTLRQHGLLRGRSPDFP